MLARRNSLSNSAKKIYIDKNSICEAQELHVEIISDAKPITSDELENVFLSPMRSIEDNAERLNLLEGLKAPYLFCSDDLIKLVEITPSLKTRIEMIQIIGPRLTDPSAKVPAFTGMFRYAEEKNTVEEVLKVRMNAINALKFTNLAGTNALKPGAGRGGAGRGGGRMGLSMAGRGRGLAHQNSGGRGSPRVTSMPVTTSPKAAPKTPLAKQPSFHNRPLPVTPTGQTASVNTNANATTPHATSPGRHSNSHTTGTSLANLERQRNPEICPEDGVPSTPTSNGGECDNTDAETIDTRSTIGTVAVASFSMAAQPSNPSAEASVAAVPVPPTSPSAASTASTVVMGAETYPDPAPVIATSSDKSQVGRSGSLDSSLTDGEQLTPPAVPSPEDRAAMLTVPAAGPVKVQVPIRDEPERRPSASLASTLFTPVSEDAHPSRATTETSSKVPSAGTEDVSSSAPASARSTPVPVMLEITARAPQRGPPVAPSRRATTNSTGPSPVPFVADQRRSPSITPSPSTGSLQAQGLSAAQSALSSGSATSTPRELPTPSGNGVTSGHSTSSSTHTFHASIAQPQRVPYDLAPMVADCKPEVGVHALLSKFSGSARPPLRPVDAPKATPPPSGRKISDLTNAFASRPDSVIDTPTSSVKSGSSRSGSGISAAEARSQAPAPIVIPGASLSLAEMRAKFSGGGGGVRTSLSTPGVPYGAGRALSPLGGSQSVASSPTRLQRSDSHNGTTSDGILSSVPTTERKLIRRHSESQFPFLTATHSSAITSGAVGGGALTSAPIAAEVAGAGADLATRCAAALHISRADFLALSPEAAVSTADGGTGTALPQYTYREIVRRNYWKEYDDLNQSVLELHVRDEDFVQVFSRTKAEYSKQPRWRQVEQKKKALLF